jgi:hypothetical protein
MKNRKIFRVVEKLNDESNNPNKYKFNNPYIIRVRNHVIIPKITDSYSSLFEIIPYDIYPGIFLL